MVSIRWSSLRMRRIFGGAGSGVAVGEGVRVGSLATNGIKAGKIAVPVETVCLGLSGAGRAVMVTSFRAKFGADMHELAKTAISMGIQITGFKRMRFLDISNLGEMLVY
jgi:hypothetical protein